MKGAILRQTWQKMILDTFDPNWFFLVNGANFRENWHLRAGGGDTFRADPPGIQRHFLIF